MAKLDFSAALRLAGQFRLKEAVAVLRGAPVIAAPAPIKRPKIFQDIAARFTPPAPAAPPDGARFETHHYANEFGSRAYKLYIPGNTSGAALPLLIMLHGCTQSPDDFATGTGMNTLAEAQKCLVAYPAQARLANLQKCWNWFRGQDQQRDSGEPSLIAGITRTIIAEHDVPPGHVYIAGLSAGGAMAAIMGALYPEIYAAIGIHSGLAFGAAHDMPSAIHAMRHGAAGTPEPAAPPTIIFQGDADTTVNIANAAQIIAQANPANLPGIAETTPAYTRTTYTDPTGKTFLESWILHGAGHAWSGGNPEGSFTNPEGPNASTEMLRFFMEHAISSA